MAAVREVIKKGDPILREKAVSVRRFDEKLAALLDDMALTMKEYDGVGLAAPQVAISKCIVVIKEEDGELIELINPVIVQKAGVKSDAEGCLSVPDLRGMVPRAKYVLVEAQDRKGNAFTLEAEDLLARIIQHEVDHLHGCLFTDIMTSVLDDDDE